MTRQSNLASFTGGFSGRNYFLLRCEACGGKIAGPLRGESEITLTSVPIEQC